MLHKSVSCPFLVAMRSNVSVYSRLVAGTIGSNLAEGMDVCLLCLLYDLQATASVTSCSLTQKSPISVHACVCACVHVCDLEINNQADEPRVGLLHHRKNIC